MVVRRRVVLGAVALLGAVAVGCAPEPAPSPEPPREIRDVAALPDLLDAASSPSGRYVADARYVAGSPTFDSRVIRVVDTADGSSVDIGGGGGYSPVPSDDGRYVTYRRLPEPSFTGPSAFQFDRVTGVETEIPSLGFRYSGFARPPAVSSDGAVVAYVGGGDCDITFCPWGNVFVWDRTTGETEEITGFVAPPVGSFAGRVPGAVEVSADGSHVVFSYVDYSVTPRSFAVVSWNRATGVSTTVATPAGPSLVLSTSSDASVIAYDVSSFDGTASGFDVELWSATPLAHTLPADDMDRASPRLSVDGDRLWYSTGAVVQWNSAELQTGGLTRVDLNTGSAAHVEIGRDVLTLGEADLGAGAELLFHERPASGRDFIEAWRPA